MMMGMTPLARAERLLAVRLQELERQVLHEKDPMAPAWRDLVATVDALTRVLDRLRPLTVAGLPTTRQVLAERRPRRDVETKA
jgi:hypothetical protein